MHASSARMCSHGPQTCHHVHSSTVAAQLLGNGWPESVACSKGASQPAANNPTSMKLISALQTYIHVHDQSSRSGNARRDSAHLQMCLYHCSSSQLCRQVCQGNHSSAVLLKPRNTCTQFLTAISTVWPLWSIPSRIKSLPYHVQGSNTVLPTRLWATTDHTSANSAMMRPFQQTNNLTSK
jgi:hypothetical protein